MQFQFMRSFDKALESLCKRNVEAEAITEATSVVPTT